MRKTIEWVFFILVALVLLAPFWVFKDLLFPFITSKAFYLRIVIEIALPFYIYLILRYKNYRPSLKNPLSLLLLVFLAINLITSFTGVNITRSLWGNFERMGGTFYVAHLILYYFYILLLAQMGGNWIRRFILWVIGISGVLAVYGMMVIVTHNHFIFTDPSYPRISATFGNPIFYASFLILPIFLTAFYFFQTNKLWAKIIYGLIVFFELVSVEISQTRGAVVGLAIGIFIGAIVYIILTPQRKLKLYGGVVLILFGLLGVGGVVFRDHFPAGSGIRRIFTLQDSNSKARLIQWGVALKGYSHYPILGVGPENYYFLSNAYYNPAIYQYDGSWFDKPHNYILEILVTTGPIGLLAYLALLAFAIVTLYRAYKSGLLSLIEMTLLLAGILSYEFQNIFVFDTIGASLMFYSFFGFVGYLWYELQVPQIQAAKNAVIGFGNELAATAAVIVAVFMVYTIYIGNILGLRIAKDVNFGYAYGAVDVATAQNYFQFGKSLPFDFDPIEYAGRYSDFALSLASGGGPSGTSTSTVVSVLNNALATEQWAIQRVPNDPPSYDRLVTLYTSLANLTGIPLSNNALVAAQTAEALAPRRPEPELAMARLQLTEGNIAAAEKTLQNVVSDIPQENQAEMQLGLLYAYSGQAQQGLAMGEQALENGFKPQNPNDIDWMGQLYAQQKDWQNAERIYMLAVQTPSATLHDYFNLAQVYAQLGNKQQAISLAQAIENTDPTEKAQMDAFIKSLQ